MNSHDDGVLVINPKCVPTINVCLGVGTDNDCIIGTSLVTLG